MHNEATADGPNCAEKAADVPYSSGFGVQRLGVGFQGLSSTAEGRVCIGVYLWGLTSFAIIISVAGLGLRSCNTSGPCLYAIMM